VRMLSTFVMLLGATALLFASSRTFVFQQIGSYPNAALTYPRSLNLGERVVGFDLQTDGNYHGYLQVGSVFKTIQPAGSISSYLEGINDLGVAVGGYCDVGSCNPETAEHGFLYSRGKYTKLDYPATGTSLAAEGINNLGEVVGGYCPGSATCPLGLSPSNHAFLLHHGVFTTLDYPGAIATLAYAINDSGSMVGYYEDSSTRLHGYLYRNGVFTTIDYPNSDWTIPLGVNNAGIVSGIYEDFTTLITHGFTYANGVFTQIDVPNSTATGLGGINNRGDVTATANVNGVGKQFVGIPVQ
jgi:probable HAF family extracellular repeat protein